MTRVMSPLFFAFLICLLQCVASFSSSNNRQGVSSAATIASSTKNNNILILDHLNINHQKGRHDWLKAFYIDFLQCALDPRKMQNVEKGEKTIWANIGAQQVHLPEGKPDAQVLDGLVTLVYPDLKTLESRSKSAQEALQVSKFDLQRLDDSSLMVTDPWGSKFKLVSSDSEDEERDSRGSQPGEMSEGVAMRDITIHTPSDCNLQGIGRFYEQILGSCVASIDDDCVRIAVGPKQTLTFQTNPFSTVTSHVDLRDEEVEIPEGAPTFLSNYGPHVSMYVADLPSAYRRADDLGVAYVNPRFSRRAYTLDQAIDDCMFRCLDIVDPDNVEAGPILKLEHEVRSVVKRDGSKYKSCPFDQIPDGCISA